MKKDEHQPASGTTGDPQTSSTGLALQQLNKEAEKKEAAAESAKIRCRICFKETAPTPRCFGHGGGGGGGGEGGGSDNTSEEKSGYGHDKPLIKSDHLVDDTEELLGEFRSTEESEELDPESHSDEKSFDPGVIAELVAKGLLVIDNDRKSLTLTINLQCDPNSLSEEQREELKKFMKAILNEFNAFKEKHHLSDDCLNMTEDEEGNIVSLRISLPTLKIYDEFIQQLAHNLLPTPSPKFQTKGEHKETKDFAPTPLSMEPKPTDKNKHLVHDVANQNKDISGMEVEPEDKPGIFELSPYLMKMKPW
ncbi:hypothetical protein OQJ13_14425 [Legionella sp. PATHC035]|uniref:hypothetical protein n=1 Tax=Legionella sp. PATHC035 TaxID=2992040 RepID=UPI0022435BBC|nr:hypothetical protein [Legionella sp. PATHC035]MCW8410172.1 hypothetical protein [Legionella sp. PATHC035]